jgi:hypothetical protein
MLSMSTVNGQRPALPVLGKWTLAMSQTGRRDPLSSQWNLTLAARIVGRTHGRDG